MSKIKFRGTNIDSKTAIVGVIIFIILGILLEPFLIFWLGYFTGWIAKITIGTYLVKGFHTFYIPISIDQIPILCGVLAFIGSFFKNSAFKFEND